MVRFVLTGPDRSGKTSVARALAEKKYHVIPEAKTRELYRLVKKFEAKQFGEWLVDNYSSFYHQVGQKQLKLEKELERELDGGEEGVVFLDRSVFCYIAYCKVNEEDISKSLSKLAAKWQGEKYAFFLEGLSQFDEQRNFREAIRGEYQKRGFSLMSVPEFFPEDEERNIQTRADHVEACVKKLGY
jgi:predicted ATPase